MSLMLGCSSGVTWQTVGQLVDGGGDVPLLQPTLFELLHGAGELEESGASKALGLVRCRLFGSDFTGGNAHLRLCHRPGDACWSRSPDSEEMKTMSKYRGEKKHRW